MYKGGFNMASYTQHYQLHQWEPNDNFLRTDFNGDFEKIDTALGTIPKLATGSYVGTGMETDFDLGFQPAAVLLFTSEGMTNQGTDTYGGLFTPDLPLKCNVQTAMAAVVTETGFKIFGAGVLENGTSAKGVTFYYLAIKW